MARHGTLQERFEDKIFYSPCGCWYWTGNQKGGYGMFEIASRDYRAHRVSYKLYNGPIPEGLVVMHSCDRPLCVNPHHLSVGTIADNNRDMWSKGRAKINSPRSVDETDIRTMLKMADLGADKDVIARIFNLCEGSINKYLREARLCQQTPKSA